MVAQTNLSKLRKEAIKIYDSNLNYSEYFEDETFENDIDIDIDTN